jgi:AcrR family transcriptional regulator
MATTNPDTRQVVLDSAIATFARKGYAGTSVQDILRATKLSKPTLYYYFESKEGLFRAILDFAYDESFKLMKAAVAEQKTCENQLVAVATALFDFTENNQDLMRLVLGTVFAAPEELPLGCAHPARRRQNFNLIIGIVRKAQQKGELAKHYDAHKLAHGIFGAISHHIRTHLLLRRGKLDHQLAERVVDLFLNGARHHV